MPGIVSCSQVKALDAKLDRYSSRARWIKSAAIVWTSLSGLSLDGPGRPSKTAQLVETGTKERDVRQDNTENGDPVGACGGAAGIGKTRIKRSEQARAGGSLEQAGQAGAAVFEGSSHGRRIAKMQRDGAVQVGIADVVRVELVVCARRMEKAAVNRRRGENNAELVETSGLVWSRTSAPWSVATGQSAAEQIVATSATSRTGARSCAAPTRRSAPRRPSRSGRVPPRSIHRQREA